MVLGSRTGAHNKSGSLETPVSVAVENPAPELSTTPVSINDSKQPIGSTMPPRLLPTSSVSAMCRAGMQTNVRISSLTACMAALSVSQTRHASILGNLANNKGAVKEKKRVGRGPSSGHGKTSGRGHKGQGQHGKVKPWFQGGQTPLIVKHGRKGFSNQYVAPTCI